MKWTGLNELREKYLSFFESKDHLRLKSFPLLPQGDNSLLLINSGMAPMKKWFLGLETPPRRRVTTCQKCIRTPDIERVGKTSRHGTYFEMLGNFSFGDYFKVESTKWAWEFITEVLELPVDRLWVSVYEDDDEAVEIWTKNVGVDPSRIVRLGKEDNFWEIGAGPCGPCSEIYFDRGVEHGCGKPDCAVGCDCDRFVEFWNLVFSQFDNDGNGNYTRLERPNIDTGMGLERLACIMQGVDNLFEVDTVQNIMKHIMQIAGVEYKKDEKTDVSLRVITDHIRSTTFMVGDGILPQNEGRGYVLRRLLRRAARHGLLLGIKEPFLYNVCETVIKENESAYPNLLENKDYIIKVIKIEEERFAKTISQGMELLSDLIENLKKEGKNELLGSDAFKLYDTYGFPIDLISEIAEENNISLDTAEFEKCMLEQKERARAARAAMGDFAWEEDVFQTVDVKGDFVGYDSFKSESKIVAIVKDNELVETASEGDSVSIILEKTPFYAEMGGQVGDTGVISGKNTKVAISDCKKSKTGHFIHVGEIESGMISVGDTVEAHIDELRRKAIMRNHTACHLLQAALRQVLGTHVHQAGSMVDEHICRFDFSHFNAMTDSEIKAVENIVNSVIFKAVGVNVDEMSLDEAKEKGAMALFGEKYSDVVRVCGVGDFSTELCGGTHIDNTASIGLFKILKESSVAAGVRRIEAITGENILSYIAEEESIIAKSAENLKANSSSELVNKTQAVSAELKELQKEIERLNSKLAAIQSENIGSNSVVVKDFTVGSAVLADAKPDALRTMGDKMKDKDPSCIFVFVSKKENGGSMLVVCGKDAVAKGANAGKIIKELATRMGGSGGGRPDSAMGGISDAHKAEEILKDLPSIIEAII